MMVVEDRSAIRSVVIQGRISRALSEEQRGHTRLQDQPTACVSFSDDILLHFVRVRGEDGLTWELLKVYVPGWARRRYPDRVYDEMLGKKEAKAKAFLDELTAGFGDVDTVSFHAVYRHQTVVLD